MQKSNALKLRSICSPFCCIQFPLACKLLSSWHPPCRLQAQECSSGLIHFPVPISFPLKLLSIYTGRRERAFLCSDTNMCLCAGFPHVSCVLRSERCAHRTPTTVTVCMQAVRCNTLNNVLRVCSESKDPALLQSEVQPNIAALPPRDQVVMFKCTDPESHKLSQAKAVPLENQLG